VSDDNSPIDTTLLVVSNEVSATVTVYKINHVFIPAPVAQFTSNDNSVCVGTTVQYTDQTLNNPVSWNWTFAGGNPGTSTVQNPSVLYNTAGAYNVQLIVSNVLGDTDTLNFVNYITVNALPLAPTITQINAQPFNLHRLQVTSGTIQVVLSVERLARHLHHHPTEHILLLIQMPMNVQLLRLHLILSIQQV
jgi:PKD repeat protein